jgi:hypothetical protein
MPGRGLAAARGAVIAGYTAAAADVTSTELKSEGKALQRAAVSDTGNASDSDGSSYRDDYTVTRPFGWARYHDKGRP